MDTRRIALALVAALLVAAGTTYFFYTRIRADRDKRAATVKIVAAARTLAAGTPLGADSMVLVDWPANAQISGAFAKSDDLLGRSLIYPVNQNQPILDRDIAAPGSGIGLTVKIPEGMRAVSVRSNDVVGVAGFLYPGSHVDVLVTSTPQGSPAPLTQTVLQNVEVLTAGQRIEPDPTGKPEAVSVVTLLLKPDDGQKLVLASQQGTIQFVLRNGADQNSVSTKAVTMTDLIAGAGGPAANKPPLVLKPVKKPVQVVKLDFYEVETITSGGKRAVQKFSEPSAPKATQ